MLRLIAPPVGPGSGPDEVSRWITTLEQLHREYQGLPQVLSAIEWRLLEARAWLPETREAA